SCFDWIVTSLKDDRNACGRAFGSERWNITTAGINHYDTAPNKVEHLRRQPVEMPFSKAIFNRDILALDKASLGEPIAKGGGEMLCLGQINCPTGIPLPAAAPVRAPQQATLSHHLKV